MRTSARSIRSILPEMKLMLASAAPRRAQILRDAGLRVGISRANVNERCKRGETARTMTRRLAEAKARAVVKRLGGEAGRTIVIGADTIVEVNGELLGKPRSPQAARKMLAKLAGGNHWVVTSVATLRLPDRAQVIATGTPPVRFSPIAVPYMAQIMVTGSTHVSAELSRN